jgi:hypothetical protein
MVLDSVQGADVSAVRRALLAAARQLHGKETSAPAVIDWAARFCFFEIHGAPESRCGGSPALSARWVCLSAAFVDDIKGRHGLDASEVEKIFLERVTELDRVELMSPDEYFGMQGIIEGLVETDAATVAEDKARKQEEARAAALASGLRRVTDDEGVKVTIEDAERVNQCIGIREGRLTPHQLDLAAGLSAAWKSVNRRIVDWDNDVIWQRVERLIYFLNDKYHHTKAVKKAFPELYRDEVAA